MNITNSRFLFVRHANTDKATPDIMRRLTEKGIEQALALRQKMGLDKINFDHVITSSAIRTQDTARLLLGEDVSPAMIRPLPALYSLPDEAGAKICEAMFGKLLYSDLQTYLAHPDAETLRRLGMLETRAFFETVGGSVAGKTLLIVGHAVLMNMFIYDFFNVEAIRKVALVANLGECGVIEVIFGVSPEDVIVRIIN